MSNLTDFIGGSGGLNLADITLAQTNVDVFEISDRNGTTGAVLGLLIGSDFDAYKALATINDVINSDEAFNALLNSEIAMTNIVISELIMNVIANSETAMNAITNSETAMNAINTSKLAISLIIKSEINLKMICSNSAKSIAIAHGMQLGVVSDLQATLDNGSLFNKTTTTFSQQSNTIKSELADTDTIIIPIFFEDGYKGSSGGTSTESYRQLWYGSSEDMLIFKSSYIDLDSTVYTPNVVSMRGITHNQTASGSDYYSKPTCDIYTVK